MLSSFALYDSEFFLSLQEWIPPLISEINILKNQVKKTRKSGDNSDSI